MTLVCYCRARLAELHAIVHELDDELRGILTKRDVDVLSRALPRVHAYFEQNKVEHNKEVSDARR